ncbi:hypothetical protein ARMSODRAFT_1072678 [Armillaria solidipes]|uniref:Uncharacterized protein n=1 Tax=Armillaria solidipes TaxID=1076256 RepID=A0A2H3BQM7_9AGAR|nr:hypothetical protein ARMSODRAFT_1072678 [Armillaria solidipes]
MQANDALARAIYDPRHMTLTMTGGEAYVNPLVVVVVEHDNFTHLGAPIYTLTQSPGYQKPCRYELNKDHQEQRANLGIGDVGRARNEQRCAIGHKLAAAAGAGNEQGTIASHVRASVDGREWQLGRRRCIRHGHLGVVQRVFRRIIDAQINIDVAADVGVLDLTRALVLEPFHCLAPSLAYTPTMSMLYPLRDYNQELCSSETRLCWKVLGAYPWWSVCLDLTATAPKAVLPGTIKWRPSNASGPESDDDYTAMIDAFISWVFHAPDTVSPVICLTSATEQGISSQEAAVSTRYSHTKFESL